ncbi:hypothetical protein BGZ76_007014, partial [Entomortierella beljakovae]
GKAQMAEITSTTTHEVTSSVFMALGVETSHVTYSGRHSGSIETQRQGILEEDIRKGGHLVDFARGITGFKTRPFHSRRNEVNPPMSLMRQIFPSVEDAYIDHGGDAHDRWQHECEDEINKVDPNDLDPKNGEDRISLDLLFSNKNSMMSSVLENDTFMSEEFNKFKVEMTTALQKRDISIPADLPNVITTIQSMARNFDA